MSNPATTPRFSSGLLGTAPGARLRSTVADPVAILSSEDLRQLLRFGGLLLFVALAMGVQMWARMEVRRTAVELDRTRAAVERAEVERDRLLLERTTLRSPGRLQAAAGELKLAAPVAVVEAQD
jgi:cell division protein FtsL